MDPPTILADDLTGAAEVAAFVGNASHPARVTWTEGDAAVGDPSRRSLVIDTETRNLPPDRACERLDAALDRLGAHGTDGLVYKKIDSTLRGPVRAEIALLARRLAAGRADTQCDAARSTMARPVTRRAPIIAAPAYPRMGRTTRGGIQRLDDVPVAEGPAAVDPVAAAQESDVRRLMPEGGHVVVPATGGTDPEALARLLRRHQHEGRHVVVDAETESDLAVLAEALRTLRSCVLVGSGGLARHLWPRRHAVGLRTGPGPVVVVVGSHHPSARAQVEHLCATNVSHRMTGAQSGPLPERLPEVLVLTTPASRAEPAVALRDLGGALEEVIAVGRPSALVVTGGETALHALRRLNAHALDVVGELVDGIPLGRIVGGPWAGLPLATKAGGFGRPELLAQAVSRLRSESPNVH